MQADTRATAPPGTNRDGTRALDMATIARLRQLRWREPPRGRRLAWLVLAVVALLHAVFAVMTWWAMRPPAPVPGGQTATAGDVLEVRFIAAAAPAAKAPPPVPLPPPVPARHAAVPASKNALSVRLPAPAPAASTARPRLFDGNGMPILPAVASSAPMPDYVQHMPLGDTRIMQHTNPVKYRPTRFEKYWGRGGGSAIDDVLQKAVDKTTVKHTFNLGHGIHIHCGISLAALAGGCGGDPPSPPSPKDGDVRLDMAPARQLAPNPNAAKPPALSECIALYRAGKPLADGCPSDTPIRAVDEELRKRTQK